MKRRLKLLLPIAIVITGLLGALALVATRPDVETNSPEARARLVRVVDVTPETVQLRVTTHGAVAPRTESDLVPEVSGPIVWVSPSFTSGGFFEENDPLVRIDSLDYRVALELARANLARAESELERETKELARQQNLASKEIASAAKLDMAVTAERVARAARRQARANLEKAERDLARTEIHAPFTGRVRERTADVGEFVNRGVPMARLYATDFAEIRLPISDDELAFLDLPLWYRGEETEAEGAAVELRADFAGAEHSWEGRVVRTEGEIDPKTRMVHVIARVEDPYGRSGDRPPLAVGLFVEAQILGRETEGVVTVPRAAMRGTDQLLVADTDDRLRFRDVQVIRAGRDEVVIRSGLEPGDRVIVSSVEAAVDGMEVRPVASDQVTP
jgi:RND family efflux transporter MFP subunit